jgi:hypothetical protein
LNIGSFFTDQALFSADALTFDFCRRLSCHDNTIIGGGENGIDLLSCQDYSCNDNVIKQANTAGVFVYLSDLWTSSMLTPKLASITSRACLQNQNGTIRGNDVEAFDCIHVGAGQNLHVRDNRLKPFKASSNWIPRNTPDLIAFDNTAAAEFFIESIANWERGIEFKGNKPILSGPVSAVCEFDTGLFSTLGGLAHGFVTGDRVEAAAAGSTSNFVQYPPGLDFKHVYFVIRISGTTFQLAATLREAFAATPLALDADASNGSGAALLVRERAWPCIANISIAFYTAAQNIIFDENIGRL